MEAATVSTPASRGAPRRLRRCADERLVARIRCGDERCFEVAYDRYHRQLLAFCRHMLGSREEAEDALQQVFVSAHRQLLADERPIQLKPWLYAIARNRCLSTLRDRRATVALDAAPEPSTDGLAVAAEVERRQDLKDMLADLESLPDDERAALVMAELGDLSHEDIAVALGVRKDRVKALIFQARKSLLGSREAREADCDVIQEQLATLRGGALRRSSLRGHVAVCTACAAFESEVGRQRAALGLILPVVPTVALKNGILASVLASGSGAASGALGVAGLGGAAGAGTAASMGAGATGVGFGVGAGTMLGAGTAGLAAKVLAVVAVGGGALGAGVAVQRADRDAPAPVERRTERLAPAAPSPQISGPAQSTPRSASPGRSAAAAQAAAARKARRERAKARRGSAGGPARSAAGKAAKPRAPKAPAGQAVPGTGQRGPGGQRDGAGPKRSGSEKSPTTGSGVPSPGAVQRTNPEPKTGLSPRSSGDIGAGALKGTMRTRKQPRKATAGG